MTYEWQLLKKQLTTLQDSVARENKPSILREMVHNLAKSAQTGSLYMLDNEASLQAAYHLLYPDPGAKIKANSNLGTTTLSMTSARLQLHSKQMLHSMCIFRWSTVSRLAGLRDAANPANLLLGLAEASEPLFEDAKLLSESSFAKHFRHRVEEVWQWIEQCHALAASVQS